MIIGQIQAVSSAKSVKSEGPQSRLAPSLMVPLTVAGNSVFAISTFDTDYLLVKEKDLERAVKALRGQGYNVR